MAAEQVMFDEYIGPTRVFHAHMETSIYVTPLDMKSIKALAATDKHLAIMYLKRFHHVNNKIAEEIVKEIMKEDKPAQV